MRSGLDREPMQRNQDVSVKRLAGVSARQHESNERPCARAHPTTRGTLTALLTPLMLSRSVLAPVRELREEEQGRSERFDS